MFTQVARASFLAHIDQAEVELKVAPPSNLIYALEAHFTLNYLKQKLEDRTFDEQQLTAFFKIRWSIIQSTDLQYCHDLVHPGNRACVAIAKKLAEMLKTPYLILLMPTLSSVSALNYTTSSYEEPLGLSEIVLDDRNERLIHIPDILEATQEDKLLKQNSLCRDRVLPLTENEIKKVLSRDPSIQKLYQELSDRVDFRLNGDTVGGTVKRLIKDLRSGGERENGARDNAGADAILAIIDFRDYLDSLSDEVRAQLLTAQYVDRYRSPAGGWGHRQEVKVRTVTFESEWKRLVRKSWKTSQGEVLHWEADSEEQVPQVDIPCVEQSAYQLEVLLDENKWLYKISSCEGEDSASLESFDQRVVIAMREMTAALAVFKRQNFYHEAGDMQLCMRLLACMKENIQQISVEEIVGLTRLYVSMQSQGGPLIESIVTTLVKMSQLDDPTIICEALSQMLREEQEAFNRVTRFEMGIRTAPSSPDPRLRRSQRGQSRFFNALDLVRESGSDAELIEEGDFRVKRSTIRGDVQINPLY